MTGRRYRCPVCEWSTRSFVGERKFLQKSDTGYCPRCNAKARHRRIWLYLSEHTEIFTDRVRLVEVAPWWSFARRFRKIAAIEYLGVDLQKAGPQVPALGELASLPVRSGHMDVVLCIHVLEHVDDDRKAIEELYRVLRPGGVAIVSVPLRMGRPTYEDPSVKDPKERARLFGEPSHVRYYGVDIAERLAKPGFVVSLNAADQVDSATRERYGLRSDENIFHCVKPDRGGG